MKLSSWVIFGYGVLILNATMLVVHLLIGSPTYAALHLGGVALALVIISLGREFL